ncbi:MAG: hypothetical protein R3B90_07980 [Planctomycetaceae bacterium]
MLLNIGWDQADRGMGGDSGELFAVAKNAIMGDPLSRRQPRPRGSGQLHCAGLDSDRVGRSGE